MVRDNKCDNCAKIIKDGERVTAIISGVVAAPKTNSEGSMHLKLSKNAIDSRALKIYCKECLSPKDYIPTG